jgi:hypothetical protein
MHSDALPAALVLARNPRRHVTAPNSVLREIRRDDRAPLVDTRVGRHHPLQESVEVGLMREKRGRILRPKTHRPTRGRCRAIGCVP